MKYMWYTVENMYLVKSITKWTTEFPIIVLEFLKSRKKYMEYMYCFLPLLIYQLVSVEM